MSSEKVIIVGAGVAGLSLAIMLAEQNLEIEVLVARQRFDGTTSGVRISADGVGVLRSMKVDAIGEDANRVDMRFGGLSASFSAPKRDVSAIVVTRLALHEKLVKRARSLGVRVAVGVKVAGVTETPGNVEVHSESNERVSGRWLVGADGVGSIVRHILNPAQGPTKTYAGYLGVGLLTEDEAKIEMTLHRYPGQEIGIASCGKVNEAATRQSIFIWTHIHVSERDAKLATRANIEAELAARAERWSPELRSKYDRYTRDANAALAFGPVYNGKPPGRWYSERMILIGDAAHPYGPGGQGISMALKDAKAVCDVIVRGFNEDDKKEFQRSRAEEARAFGEAAEKRNSKGPPSTALGVLAEGIAMKAMEILNRGTLNI
jgi:2-polyprenyl-6-methoxyphenol hydroxylase-like FAD-dependent oxidoreductase